MSVKNISTKENDNKNLREDAKCMLAIFNENNDDIRTVKKYFITIRPSIKLDISAQFRTKSQNVPALGLIPNNATSSGKKYMNERVANPNIKLINTINKMLGVLKYGIL